MCKIDILNQNELGYVVYSSFEEDIQIGFRTLIYTFSQNEFACFLSHINELYHRYYNNLLLSGEKIYIRTEDKKLILAFDTDELRSFWELLNEASIMLEVNNI